MSNASATTITVNTALFAAGDTVHITNLGAGVCTITAGTATVNSSASLALAQYESGFLDFTSTSAAIFVKGAGAVASGGGMTSIASGSLSGASVVLSSIPATYNQIFLELKNFHPTANGYSVQVTVTGQTSGYVGVKVVNSNGSISTAAQPTTELTGLILEAIKNDANEYAYGSVWCSNYADTTAKKVFQVQGTVKQYTNTFLRGWAFSELDYPTSAISSLTIATSGTTFAGGTYVLWGIK
jgi:hypothetical protein